MSRTISPTSLKRHSLLITEIDFRTRMVRMMYGSIWYDMIWGREELYLFCADNLHTAIFCSHDCVPSVCVTFSSDQEQTGNSQQSSVTNIAVHHCVCMRHTCKLRDVSQRISRERRRKRMKRERVSEWEKEREWVRKEREIARMGTVVESYIKTW